MSGLLPSRLLLFLAIQPKPHVFRTFRYLHIVSVLDRHYAQIFITAFDLVSKVFEELEAGQEMITPLQFGHLFVDWTNPQKSAPS